jgi:hypothetical protein
MRTIVLLSAGALLVGAVAPAAAAAAAPARATAKPLVIRTATSPAGGRAVRSLGPMQDRRWRLSSFRTAFGRPSSCGGRTPDFVVAEWRGVGVKATFYTLGLGADGCVGRNLYAGVVTLRGPRWQTDKGLKIGAATSAIAGAYPNATRKGSRWVLEFLTSQFGATGVFPTLEATSRDGVVRSFVATIGAGGE